MMHLYIIVFSRFTYQYTRKTKRIIIQMTSTIARTTRVLGLAWNQNWLPAASVLLLGISGLGVKDTWTTAWVSVPDTDPKHNLSRTKKTRCKAMGINSVT
jgi:hypothetical protein